LRKEKYPLSYAYEEDLVLAPVPFDHSRAAAFKKRLVGALNDGALCIMNSLDHRVELFDVMPASGSETIAARCGLNERYVCEWLGAMVASGVVDYDSRDGGSGTLGAIIGDHLQHAANNVHAVKMEGACHWVADDQPARCHRRSTQSPCRLSNLRRFTTNKLLFFKSA
jgi:hypothetical protein